MGDYLHKQYNNDNISNDELDEMIEELQTDFEHEPNDMQEAYLSKLDEILQVLRQRVNEQNNGCSSIATTSTEYVKNYGNKKVSELTIGEFESIIRKVVREEVGTTHQYIPFTPQPAWYGPGKAPETPWWLTSPTCETQTTMKTKEQIND